LSISALISSNSGLQGLPWHSRLGFQCADQIRDSFHAMFEAPALQAVDDLLGGAWVPEIRGADLRWLYDEKDDCCPDGGLFSKRSHGVESPHNCPGSEPQMGTWCGSRANHAAGTSWRLIDF